MRPPSSISLIKKYFKAKGYGVETMLLGQSPQRRFVTIRSPKGAYITLSSALPTYPFATASGEEIINNKIRTYDLGNLLGISTPVSYVVPVPGYDAGVLRHLLDSYGPLVVKPHNGSMSNGVTINIKTFDELMEAIRIAAGVSDTVLVQQQVSGDELRFIAIGGSIRSVLLSQRPLVIGDGTSTLAELIEAENESRRNIRTSLLGYPQLNATVISQEYLHDQRIPEKGEQVVLGTTRMIYQGASVYDVLSTIHPSYIEIAQRLTERFGRGLAAADLIIQDYAKPAQPHNYVLLEMNHAISLPMCYSCRDGRHFPIVEEYLGPMIEAAMN